MTSEQMTGRQARGTTSPPYPNTPNDLIAPPCDPQGAGRPLAGLAPAVRCHGSVRLPLSLHVAPAAHLHDLSDGSLVWQVRLPGADAAPVWTTLPRLQPVRWARASGFPLVEAAARQLLARAEIAGPVARALRTLSGPHSAARDPAPEEVE